MATSLKLLASSFLFLILPFTTYAERPVKIGAILHLTGDLAMQEVAFREGLELAVAELNKDKLRYKLLIEDAKNSARESFTKTTKLTTQDKAPVIILSSAVDAMTCGPLLERKKIPSITLWDSNPDMDAIGNYLFSIGPWTPSSAEKSAEFIWNKLNAKKVALIYNREPWSEKVAQYFTEFYPKLGGEIVASFPINPEDSDFRSVLTKIKSLNIDAIYTPLAWNIVPFYTQLYQLKLGKPVVSSDIIVEEHISKAPEAFEGIYQTNLLDPSSSEFHAMSDRYQKYFNKPVTLGWFVAVAYDAMMIIDKVVSDAGSDPERIKEQLYKIKNFKGTSTEITINENGSSPQFETMYQIQHGKFVLLN